MARFGRSVPFRPHLPVRQSSVTISYPITATREVYYDSNATGTYELYVSPFSMATSVRVTANATYNSYWPKPNPTNPDHLMFERSVAAASPHDDITQCEGIWVIDLSTGVETRILLPSTFSLSWIGHVEWSPDGLQIVGMVGAGTATAIATWTYDPSTKVCTFVAFIKTLSSPSLVRDPTWSRDGTKLYWVEFNSGSTSTSGVVRGSKVDGSGLVVLSADSTHALQYDPYESPDGTKVLILQNTTGSVFSLATISSAGGSWTYLINDGNVNSKGNWLSDTLIYFHRLGGTDFGVSTIHADGTGVTTLLDVTGVVEEFPQVAYPIFAIAGTDTGSGVDAVTRIATSTTETGSGSDAVTCVALTATDKNAASWTDQFTGSNGSLPSSEWTLSAVDGPWTIAGTAQIQSNQLWMTNDDANDGTRLDHNEVVVNGRYSGEYKTEPTIHAQGVSIGFRASLDKLNAYIVEMFPLTDALGISKTVAGTYTFGGVVVHQFFNFVAATSYFWVIEVHGSSIKFWINTVLPNPDVDTPVLSATDTDIGTYGNLFFQVYGAGTAVTQTAIFDNVVFDQEIGVVSLPSATPISSSDTGSGSESNGAIAATLTSPETGSGLEAVTSIGLTNADLSAAAVEAVVKIGVSTTETGSGTDTNGTTLTSATDTASGLDAGTQIAFSNPDTGSGLDAVTKIGPSTTETGSGSDINGTIGTSAAETSSGTDTGTLAATLTNTDTGSGLDAGSPVVNVTSTDTGSGLDAVLKIGISTTETASGSDTNTTTGTSAADLGAGLDVNTTTGTSSTDTTSGLDAGSISTAITDTDTSSGVDAVLRIALSNPDTVSGLDAVTAIGVSTTETGSGSDINGSVATSAADIGSGLDAGVVVTTLSNTDTGSGLDVGTIVAAVTNPDVGSGTDVSTSVGLSSPDVSSALDAVVKIGISTTETGSGTDTNGTIQTSAADLAAGAETNVLAVTLSNTETGTGAETGVQVGLSTTDTGSGSDTQLIAISVSSTDTGSGLDAGSSIGVSVATDTTSGLDAATVLATLSTTDTGSGLDALTSVGLSNTDISSGLDVATKIGISTTETGSGVDAGVNIGTSAAETGLGSDAGLSIGTNNTDTGSGLENQTIAISVSSVDVGSGSDAGTSIGTSNPDTGSATDSNTLAAVLSTTDTVSGLDAVSLIALSTTDTGSATENQTIAISVSSTDTGSGLDSGTSIRTSGSETGSGSDTVATLSASLASPETGSGLDSVTSIALTSTDTGSDTEAQTISISVSSTDTGSGSDTVTKIALTNPDTGSGLDAGTVLAVATYPIVGTREIYYDSNATGNYEVYVSPFSMATSVRITANAKYNSYWPKVNPTNPTQIMFERSLRAVNPHDDVTQCEGIWVVDLSTGVETRILLPATYSLDWIGHVEWSPDGLQIVGMCASGGATAVATWAYDPSTKTCTFTAFIRVLGTPSYIRDPSWSRDGTKLYWVEFNSGSTSTSGVVRASKVDGSGLVVLSPDSVHPNQYDPYESPNAAKVLILNNPSGSIWSLSTIAAAGGSWTDVINDGNVNSKGSWLSDTVIYFHRLGGTDFGISKINANGTGVTTLLDVNGVVEEFPQVAYYIFAVSSTDTGSGADTGTINAGTVQVSSSDTGSATDLVISIGLSVTEVSSGAEGNPRVGTSSNETSSGSDQVLLVGLSTTEIGSGADLGLRIGTSAADISSGLDTSTTVALLTVSDSGISFDTVTKIGLSAIDLAAGIDTVVVIGVSAQDQVSGVDAGTIEILANPGQIFVWTGTIWLHVTAIWYWNGGQWVETFPTYWDGTAWQGA